MSLITDSKATPKVSDSKWIRSMYAVHSTLEHIWLCYAFLEMAIETAHEIEGVLP